jgi:heme/copper-type cytochrome/quinol oxidase subunit 3
MKFLYLGLKSLLSLGLLGTAFMKLTQQARILESFDRLGYPTYLTYILGFAYLLGVIGIWQAKSATIREWAYAGAFFALTGAVASHILSGDPFSVIAPAAVFWALVVGVYVLDRQIDNIT